MMLQQGSEDTQSGWGCCSGSFDQLGYEVLTCSLDNITNQAPPSGLSYVLYNGQVQLSWWGSAYAQSYNIIRAPQRGSYVPATNGLTDPLSYSETVPPGVYNYVVVAQPNNYWSQPLKVVANPQALVLYYTFDVSSVFDASLERN